MPGKTRQARRVRFEVGANWTVGGREHRAEPGDVRDDVPPGIVDVWLADGVCTAAGGSTPAPAPDEPADEPDDDEDGEGGE